ncbi:hypothetical protein SRHO_G00115520 [Serrasalmus rhombeus]
MTEQRLSDSHHNKPRLTEGDKPVTRAERGRRRPSASAEVRLFIGRALSNTAAPARTPRSSLGGFSAGPSILTQITTLKADRPAQSPGHRSAPEREGDARWPRDS